MDWVVHCCESCECECFVCAIRERETYPPAQVAFSASHRNDTTQSRFDDAEECVQCGCAARYFAVQNLDAVTPGAIPLWTILLEKGADFLDEYRGDNVAIFRPVGMRLMLRHHHQWHHLFNGINRILLDVGVCIEL